MGYKVFDAYSKGYSHVKDGKDCEDYADSYADSDGRFYISVICDGHSDNNCFRSSKGARFGCEAAIEIIKRFFELYYENNGTIESFTPETELRLKKSIKQCWDNKVLADIQDNPITEAEMEPLADYVKNLYKEGRGLKHIYGATFIAAAVSNDVFIALHIGDGIMLCFDSDGTCYNPLSHDEKSDTGEPASWCDSDLFTREGAFRSVVSGTIPQAVVMSSDGIQDSIMDQVSYMEEMRSVLATLISMETSDSENEEKLNENQQRYLDSCTAYWADKGNGVEDDCSLSGIYLNNKSIPEVRIPCEEAESLWKVTNDEKTNVISDYEKRKASTLLTLNSEIEDSLRLGMKFSNSKKLSIIDAWIEKKRRIGEFQTALYHIVHNETKKVTSFDERLKKYEKYILLAGGELTHDEKQPVVTSVPDVYFTKDEKLADVIAALEDYREKRETRNRIKQKDISEDQEEDNHSFLCKFGRMKKISESEPKDLVADEDYLEVESPELATAEETLKKSANDLIRIFNEALSADQEFADNIKKAVFSEKPI